MNHHLIFSFSFAGLALFHAQAEESALSLFSKAELSGDTAKLQQALDMGFDANQPISIQNGRLSYTPLAIAVSDLADRPQIVCALVAAGADVNARCSDGLAPLHLASIYQFPGAVAALLKEGADANAAGKDGDTALHYASKPGEGGQCRSASIILLLYTAGADLNARNNKGETPLHIALRTGNQEIMRLLLDLGADSNATDAEGATPLFTAVERADAELFHTLLKYGAKADAVRTNGTSLLDAAIISAALGKTSIERQADMIRLLLKSDAVNLLNIKDQGGSTPLRRAALCPHGAVLVRLLLDAGADANMADNRGLTPLSYAAKACEAETTALLLERGASIGACDSNHDNILQAAAMQKKPGAAATCALLIRRGMKPDTRALFNAAASGTPETTALLLQQGLDPNAVDERGYTPLCVASGACTPALIAAGADVRKAGPYGYTPLHNAAGRVSWYSPSCKTDEEPTDKARLLIAAGADVNARTARGMTPLMTAHWHKGNGPQVHELLLAAGADPNARDNDGKTALMWFASVRYFVNGEPVFPKQRLDCVRILLQAGADPSLQDNAGKTALQYAEEAGNRPMADLIRQSANASQPQ